MTEYITKYDFIRLMQAKDNWKNLVPANNPLKWEYTPNYNLPFEMRWSFVEYDKELNPMWHLENANKLLSFGYITNTRFNAIKLRCAVSYWNRWFSAKEWRQWYNNYCYRRDKEEARKRFAPIFVKEYIDKQKKELAAGCSKLVFEDGFQIPEEVQNKIMEYM